ncbi:WecB/TagA/CpsF family glycosyltransferase [Rhodococcus sp. NPDC058514]|uniref:WecB/TagA/CpsF family glycosyltransferase n=1 Tax=unclassified Rhodococcus (in: high G+C Gram-positive bacteria) TaxID=192944 RepID=UPI003662E4FE
MSAHPPPWPRMVVDQVAVDLIDRESAISLIFDALTAPGPLAVASANLDHIHHFGACDSWVDRPPAVSVDGPTANLRWLTLLDGVPLVRKAKALTGREWPKLSGSDLIEPILERAARDGARIGFLGGSAETHGQLNEAMDAQYPRLEVVGTWAPDRSELTDVAASARLAQEIREAAVEILVVALGKPRQEKWIAQFGVATDARVLLAFGAVVDFLAGRIPRAPHWATNDGLEWAWRLAREPRRLGHRYLIEGPPALLCLERRSRAVAAGSTDSARTAGARETFVPMGSAAAVTIVVVTYNSVGYLSALIDGLRVAAREHRIRLIIVDNQSSDSTVEFLQDHPDIHLIQTGGNLGYSGAINAALPVVDPCDAVLILNPDLEVRPHAVGNLLSALDDPGVGAVVPTILDGDGAIYPSLRREPSLTRAIGDALMGSHFPSRPGFLSEIDYRPADYATARDVDWATGAAILVRSTLARELGQWNEEFFLYSEETEYCRRIRSSGNRIRYEPSSVMSHHGGGSGTSPALATLMAVNRIRYVQRYHGFVYTTLFRGVVAVAEVLRSYDPDHRRTLGTVLRRRRWLELPCADSPAAQNSISGELRRGSVVVPAYNESAVIERTLAPLSRAAVDGYIELIVVCNGCRDDTADIARAIPGVTVLELVEGSKTAALNTGDEAATLWPRLYLDADIQVSASAVLAVLDRLADGDALAARPTARYDYDGANAIVRSYYRARQRIPQHRLAMWGAGAYGLSAAGHERIGAFPDCTADDLFVDAQFDADEKAVVATDPSVVTTPANARSLLAILRRGYRGVTEAALPADHRSARRARPHGASTALELWGSVRGPRSAADAMVYTGMALAARVGARRSASAPWERDDSSRLDPSRPSQSETQ